VDDHLFLKIFDGEGNLSKVVASFQLCDSFAAFDQFVQRLRGMGSTWLVQSSRMM
jgi:selenophosphate synthase